VELIKRVQSPIDVLRGLIHNIWIALVRRQFENRRHGTFAVTRKPLFDEKQFDERRQRDLKIGLVSVEKGFGVIGQSDADGVVAGPICE
jgi:hypothetical protein